ncbi:YadA C-terminal domain-containing protein [Providencia stuartii]|uniref:YadA C-terminal domain-containing protein n=1 Tax=Providencia stuartii TaxID=588 RepID=UPI002888EF34|nr:YadA-like family protein [Providencia stuartii]MDT1067790.1 YadA-like family protein [Providencia stuartii]
MKLTKIAAVLITTLGLSSAAFASEIPHPPIANPDSIINKLPKPTQPGPSDVPPMEGPNGPIIQKPGYSPQESYDAAHTLGEAIDDAIRSGQTIVDRQDAINKKQAEENVAIANNIQKNADDIAETNGRIDDAIRSGQTALDSTNEKLDTAISKGQTALAETNGAIKDTNSKLDSSLEEQKKVNYLVGNALASNESYWQQQWATNDNYAASINQNKSDIAKNRQDINKLNSRVDRLDQKVDDLNDTMKRGFASQAALNGLFQPYGVGKLNATMALGGYESKTAIAAGTGYRFDENTAVKAGIATNTDDFKGVTYNVGVNFEW